MATVWAMTRHRGWSYASIDDYRDQWIYCRDMLRELEWMVGPCPGECPECGGCHPDHCDECELSALLAVDIDRLTRRS